VVLTNWLRQSEIVTLAVYRLNGVSAPVDTEDVAIEANRLAPGMFSWRKYKDQINLELVRVNLSDAKKKSHQLLTGSGNEGWRLTKKGLQWAQQADTKHEGGGEASAVVRLPLSPGERKRLERERKRLQTTSAWRNWRNGGNVPSLAESKEVFRIDSYTIGAMQETKITRLVDMFSDEPEMLVFFDVVEKVIKEDEDEHE